jgi:SAM-dependent methyltransferase
VSFASRFRLGPRWSQVTGTDLLLNLGCGQAVHPDWVNVDVNAGAPGVYRHDLRKPVPLAGGCCAAVYHSHLLEHFPRDLAPEFLSECYRLLKSGGILRVVVPDLETIARLYLQNLEGALAKSPGAAERYEWMVLELLDQLVRDQSGGAMLKYWAQDPMPAEEFVVQRCGWEALHNMRALRQRRRAGRSGCQKPASPREAARFRASGELHRWMYDRYSLSELLRRAGFRDIAPRSAGESAIPNFLSYNLEITPEGAVRKPDSLFMEAAKS